MRTACCLALVFQALALLVCVYRNQVWGGEVPRPLCGNTRKRQLLTSRTQEPSTA